MTTAHVLIKQDDFDMQGGGDTVILACTNLLQLQHLEHELNILSGDRYYIKEHTADKYPKCHEITVLCNETADWNYASCAIEHIGFSDHRGKRDLECARDKCTVEEGFSLTETTLPLHTSMTRQDMLALKQEINSDHARILKNEITIAEYQAGFNFSTGQVGTLSH
jgi:hypothetical protein